MAFLLIMTGTIILAFYIAYLNINNCFQVNKQYDKWLNDLMDKGTPLEEKSYYTVRFKDTTANIWVQNYPYAYGYTYGPDSGFPTMRTRKRLAAYIASH